MNSISSTKISFYFRSDASVKNAILKIKNLLISINNNSINSPTIESMKHDKENKGIILTLYNPKLELTFYKKEINILNKSPSGESQGKNDFILSLKSMEEDLYKSFTEIRINNSSSSLNKRKNSQDIKEVIDIKGYSKTDVFLSLSYDDGEPVIIQPSLDSYIEGSIRNIKETGASPIPKETIKSDEKIVESIPIIKFDEKIVETKPVRSPAKSKKVVKDSGPVLHSEPGLLNVEAKPTIRRGKKNIESKTPLAGMFLGAGYKFNKISLPTFSNMLNYFPNLGFASFSKQIVVTTSDLLLRGILFIYFTFWTVAIFISGINFLVILTQWLPFIHNVNVNLLSLGSIFDTLVNSFKYINTDVLTPGAESLRNNLQLPISDNEIKVGTVTEFVKDVMSNTVVTLSDNMSTSIDTPRENSSIVNKPDTLIINEDETKEEDNNGYFNIIQKVFYVAIAFVAIDLVTGFPSNITFNDPEIISYLGDFVGGIVSMGLVGISTILQIIFGDSDNDKDNSKRSDKSVRFFSHDRPEKEVKMTLEYKDSENNSVKMIKDKITKAIQFNNSHHFNGSESSTGSNIRADTILGFNNSGPSGLNSMSSKGQELLGDISNLGQNVLNKGDKLIKDISHSSERLVNNTSNTGQNIMTSISNNGTQLISSMSNISNPLTSSGEGSSNSRLSWGKSYTNLGLNNEKLISPWGASFSDPRKETIDDGLLDSTIRLFKRQGDRTFARYPNSGPLETHLTDSDIPIIQINDRRLDLTDPNVYNPSPLTTIDEEPVFEERNSKRRSDPQSIHSTEEIFIINNVIDNQDYNNYDDSLNSRIKSLEEDIINSTTNINSETKDQIKSLIHYYTDEVRTLYEIVDKKDYQIHERDTHIQMDQDVLKFQEKEIKVLKTHELEQEHLIKDQEKNLIQSHIALTSQEEVIFDQSKTIENQLKMIEIQDNKIGELRKAINQCETALVSLAGSIENTNGESLLNENDRKEFIRSLITGNSTEEIKPRFEELRNRSVRFNPDVSILEESIPLQPINKGKEVATLYNGFKDNSISQAPYPSINSNNSESSSVSTFVSRLPIRSSSLKRTT